MIVLLCGGNAAHPQIDCVGKYLADMDFDARHDERAVPGSGRATFTDDIDRAKRFADMAEMHRFYCTIPAAHPTRADGQPNRPMTGYHWQIVDVPA